MRASRGLGVAGTAVFASSQGARSAQQQQQQQQQPPSPPASPPPASPRGAGAAGASSPFDVAVIGGGVVGLAVARECAVRGASVVLLEREDALAAGASSGNSGLGCTGYDAPVGSLERRLLRRSIARHPQLYRSFGLSCVVSPSSSLSLLNSAVVASSWKEGAPRAAPIRPPPFSRRRRSVRRGTARPRAEDRRLSPFCSRQTTTRALAHIRPPPARRQVRPCAQERLARRRVGRGAARAARGGAPRER